MLYYCHMLIDGKAIADQILAKLSKDVFVLKARDITPTLTVILIGDDPASLAYIKQKQKAAAAIGVNVIFSHQSSVIRKDDLKKIVLQYNNDPNIHGIIIQRPIAKELGEVSDILHLVAPKKDVDGFLPNSPFSVPVAIAVEELLTAIYKYTNDKSTNNDLQISRFADSTFSSWIKIKNVIVIGRGETAGKPIAEHLTKLGCNPTIIHSQTPNTKELMKSADIIISCVGKEHVVTSENIKEGVMLISVGIWRDSEGKLHGDYDEQDIASKASWYTPTPKGVGPVNVACLMQNLVLAIKYSH